MQLSDLTHAWAARLAVVRLYQCGIDVPAALRATAF